MKDILFTLDQLVPVSEAQRHLKDYIEKTKNGPLFITRNRDIKAVLLSLEDYRKLLGGKE